MVMAIVLARGGSKAIPRKNLAKVGGITLVGRAVLAAKDAPCVKTVLVSTDDPAIRAEAIQHGADVIDRPEELAGDTVSSEAAMLQAVQAWQQQTQKSYRAVALVQATSPFTTPADVDRTMAPILDGHADSTLSVVDDFGYFWAEGERGWSMPHQVRARRQDRMPWKRESGNVYGVRFDLFLRTGQLFQGRVLAVTIAGESFHEIDDPRELAVAQAIQAVYSQRREDDS